MPHIMRARLPVLLLFSLICSLPGAGMPAVAAESGSIPRFEAAACPWKLPGGSVEGKNVSCGFVVVPEQHAKPDGPTIRLPVAVFKSASANPAPDPIVYIQGGPGGAAADFISGFLDGKVDTYTANRDLIAYDQRGVGFAQPTLDCPEVRDQDLADAAVQISPEEKTSHEIASIFVCRDRLLKQGINLSAYTSAEGAADLNDIRVALGYPKLDLFGTSYGTRVALTMMRDFPSAIRSAILDSSVPFQANLLEDDGPNFDRAFKLFFAACVASADCNAKHPTLQADYSALVTKLNAQPISTTAKDDKTGKTFPVVVDGNTLTFLISQMLYDATATDYIAPLIEEVKMGQTRILKLILDVFGPAGPDINIGAFFSTLCAEEMPFNNRERATANVRGLISELQPTFTDEVREYYDVCAQWPIGPVNPIEAQAVTSDLPALVLSSDNDPATPPDYGTQVARTLSHGFLIAFPGIGHSILGNGGDCGLTIMLAFVNDPTKQPATDCIGKT